MIRVAAAMIRAADRGAGAPANRDATAGTWGAPVEPPPRRCSMSLRPPVAPLRGMGAILRQARHLLHGGGLAL